MSRNHNTPKKSFKSKDKHFISQKKRVLKEFKHCPNSVLAVAIRTKILRGNIYRYVAEFVQNNLLFYLGDHTCPITKRKVKFYTSQPTNTSNSPLNTGNHE